MGNTAFDTAEILPLPDDEGDWNKKTPYVFQGMGIVIEYLAYDTRTKTKGNGILVTNTMPSAYGFILHTTDIHGEEIDMYLCDTPSEDAPVFVIDQVDLGTGVFDEHKVMLGFDSIDHARETYLSAFGDNMGQKRLGAITTFDVVKFHEWLNSEGYSLQPASKSLLADGKVTQYAGITTVSMHPKVFAKDIDEAGGVIIDLPDLSKGPKIKTSANDEGHLEYTLYLFSAIDTKKWSNVIDTFCRIMDLADSVNTIHIKIASPGGSVFLMGRIVSAIKKTRAKVITYAQGPVASAATTVWAAGHERHILPGAYFMQHMSSQLASGKTTDIAATCTFCVEYITRQLNPLVEIGLFTQEEVSDMIEKSADIFMSGRKAISRVGKISTSVPAV